MLNLKKDHERDFEPGNLSARIAAGVGGSDAPVICGEDPYNTPVRAAAIYSGLITRDENSCMWWGHRKEPDMLAKARADGIPARRVPHVVFHSNPERSYMYAHLDGRVLKSQQIIECKLVSDRMRHHWGTPGTDQVPRWVYVQCQHNMEVTRAKSCLVIALFGGNDQKYYRLKHQQPVCDEIAFLEKVWLDKVRNGKPLEPMDRDDLLLLHGKGEGRAKKMDQEMLTRVSRRERLRKQVAELEKEQRALEFEITADIGPAHYLEFDKKRIVSFAPQKNRHGGFYRSFRVNAKKLAEAIEGKGGFDDIPN